MEQEKDGGSLRSQNVYSRGLPLQTGNSGLERPRHLPPAPQWQSVLTWDPDRVPAAPN